MLRSFAALGVFLSLFVACRTSAPVNPPTATVTAAVVPTQLSLPPLDGHPQPIAAFRDSSGTRAQLVEGYLLVTPRSAADLQRFLDRYGGQVVRDDRIPEPPPGSTIPLTAEQGAAKEFLVLIDLARVDLTRFGTLAGRARWQGAMEFSSDAGLRTFVAALDARAQGFRADANFIYEFDQALPVSPQALPLTLLNSSERAGADAFAQPLFGAPPAGAAADVVRAWQFVAAHGIQRQVNVAILDGGFLLTPTGQSQGGDSDFIAPPATPIQVDIAQGDAIADGPNLGTCTGGTPCLWHGTGSASVAVGILNNNAGLAGTGSVVGNVMLFKIGNSRRDRNAAVRRAAAMGADVISMSFGTICDSVACREADREDTPFDAAFGAPSAPVFVASAGNGEGGNGFDVGSPKFYHPCIEDHVICVGALNTGAANAMDRIQYSNFGERVDVFAPTNIPVMTTPANNNGLIPFGGTSASAPYVAGIAAMMKAIDPSLDSDQVVAILRQTARPGVGDAKRVVDALAAVRRAAQPFAMVKDRHEPNSLESNPRDLGVAASYTENNLNLDASDRDYFRFNVPGASTATVRLRYASLLGTASIFKLYGDAGPCAEPRLVSDTPLPTGNGSSIVYQLAGGPHVISTKADTILAYDLGIGFVPAVIAPDGFEANNVPAQARYLYSFRFASVAGIGVAMRPGLTSSITIDATIHNAGDVDWYIVRGVDTAGKEIGLTGTHILFNTPAVMLYANESRVDLTVFEIQADGTPGAVVGHLVSNSCTPESLTVKLESNVYYLVRVAGDPGAYKLNNGINTSSRRHPIKQRDVVYEALHPGEPVESAVDFTRYYAVAVDPGYDGITAGDGVHLTLYDGNGEALREAESQQQGERLSLSGLSSKGMYVLEVARRGDAPNAPPAHIQWSAVTPARVSANLIENPGAERSGDAAGTSLAGWKLSQNVAEPAQSVAYAQVPDLLPSVAEVRDRGERLFAGSQEGSASGLSQTIAVDAGWRESIDRGQVEAAFSAWLGGRRRQGQRAAAKLSYLNARSEPIGELALPSIGARERKTEPALVPVNASEPLPAGTAFLVVTLQFEAGGERSGGGYADQLQLVLGDFVAGGDR